MQGGGHDEDIGSGASLIAGKDAVGKVQHPRPVVGVVAVLPAAPHVAQARADGAGVKVGRPCHAGQPLPGELLPDGTGSLQGEELALRIEPLLIETLHQQGAGCHAGQEQMLVEGHLVLVPGILAVGTAVPVGEHLCLRSDVLPIVTLGQGHPAAIMDTSFASQAMGIVYMVQHHDEMAPGVFRVPEEIDTEIARIKLASLGIKIDVQTKEQYDYIHSWQEGT